MKSDIAATMTTTQSFVSKPTSPTDTYNSILDTQAGVANELFSERLGALQRPVPSTGSGALVQILMIRDTIDLSCRETVAVTNWAERSADSISLLTQYVRRKQIIPAVPSLIELKKVVSQTVTALDAMCVPWARDDAGADDFRTALHGDQLDTYMSGRQSLLGIGTAQVQCGRLLMAISRIEAQWGSFDIWVQQPEERSIAALSKAFLRREHDAEDFLDELICDIAGIHRYAPRTIAESEPFQQLNAIIAELLWNKGHGPASTFTSIEHLKQAAKAKGRRRQRARGIELGGEPVISLDDAEIDRHSAESAMVADCNEITTNLLRAIAPREIDRKYLHLKLVEQMPPRKIREELASVSEAEFKALQHRCNDRLRLVRQVLRATGAATRRSQRDAILRLLSSSKRLN
jgi:hypothetical protein